MKPDCKKTYFAAAIDKYFAHWILKTTWWKGNLQDEERFHEFVLAVHKLSKPVGGKSSMGKCVRDEDGNCKTDEGSYLIENGGRNPRTYDKGKFMAKIIDAVKSNHTFNDELLEKYATGYANRAMDLLDFLWQTRNGLPNLREWNPPLR